MKLVQLRLRNFRCYQQEVTINIEKEITALVGRNDAGKSTILDALNIFFNDATLDKHDACKSGDAKDVAIICVFEDLPDKIVLDETAPTSLQDEYLLNKKGQLEILKIFNADLEKPKLDKIKLWANHPTADNAKDLVNLTNNELKERAKKLGANLENIDKTINHQLRRVIRESIGDLQLTMTEIPLMEKGKMKANAANFWDGIQKQLPLFALFKSDRSSTDQDEEAQDPLTTAVKEALKQKENELNEIAGFVQQEVQKVADLTLQKIQKMDESLAQTLSPECSVPQSKWASLFKVSITGDNNIPINKRGSGVRRLILLNFFRAKAELQASSTGQHAIYAIEEPETSQHPNNQRLLFQALRDLSGENQVIITTHTPVLTRLFPDCAIRFLHEENGEKQILCGGDDGINQKIVDSLGILPDHNVKLFICVEGKHDIEFLIIMSRILSTDDPSMLNLEQLEHNGKIIFVPTGGSALSLWVEGRLKGLQRPELHLYDRDTEPPKYQAEIDKVNARPNCKALCTNKRMAENYIHKDLIISALRSQKTNIASDDKIEILSSELQDEFTNIPDLFKNHLGWKPPHTKDFIWRVAKGMTKEHLDENTKSEVIGWFKTMKELCMKDMIYRTHQSTVG